MNNFDKSCPSGNTLVDGFKPQKGPIEGNITRWNLKRMQPDRLERKALRRLKRRRKLRLRGINGTSDNDY